MPGVAVVPAGREEQASARSSKRPCKGEPQTVTKRGRRAVVVLAVAEYERLRRNDAKHRPSFVDHLLAFPQGDDGDFEFEPRTSKPRDIEF